MLSFTSQAWAQDDPPPPPPPDDVFDEDFDDDEFADLPGIDDVPYWTLNYPYPKVFFTRRDDLTLGFYAGIQAPSFSSQFEDPPSVSSLTRR